MKAVGRPFVHAHMCDILEPFNMVALTLQSRKQVGLNSSRGRILFNHMKHISIFLPPLLTMQ